MNDDKKKFLIKIYTYMAFFVGTITTIIIETYTYVAFFIGIIVMIVYIIDAIIK